MPFPYEFPITLSARPKTETLTENFNLDDPAVWRKVGNAAVVSNRASVPARFAGSFFTNTPDYFESVETYDFTNSYVYGRVFQVPAAASNNIYSCLRVRSVKNTDQMMDMMWYMDGNLYGNEWFPAQFSSTAVYNATNHAWWRISNSGNTMIFDAAPDSAGAPGTWTNIRSVARTTIWDMTQVKIQIQAGYQSGPDVGVVGSPFLVDNINTSGVATVDLPPLVRRPNYGSLLQL